MQVLVIDNYDSFTYNLVHFLGELGARLTVRRNDKITVDEVEAMRPGAIVISPGPCTPNEAGICLELIERTGPEIPIFGVCLGHQAMGQVYGGKVVRAPSLMHGKVSEIRHTGRGVFHGINGTFRATRYHSLTIAPDTMPAVLEVTALADDGVIMGAMHKTYPVHGVQFHPESIASEHGHLILKNFLDIATKWNAKHRLEETVA
ncbi:MAG: aminodeoxychorismate/anthranilate synthase component II [Bauldia sp.]|nr:aminodeoxychorismate/anthranilate synthase component II [Bauldia sp.]